MNKRYLFGAAIVGAFLCFLMHIILFCEELNIKQLERETAELVQIEAAERVKYFQTLNENGDDLK